MPTKRDLSQNATPKPPPAQAVRRGRKPLVPLERSFFDHDPARVARELLGKVLVRRERAGFTTGRIVECEAYLGSGDPASHAYRGMTPRNAVMFGEPGHCYVYFTYGMHYCANVACQPVGMAGAVLLRALEPIDGVERMKKRRHTVSKAAKNGARRFHQHELTSGPARLCEALAINRQRDNGKDLTDPASDLYIADDGFRPGKIAVSPRIGISQAADRPLRFYLDGNRYVSGKRG